MRLLKWLLLGMLLGSTALASEPPQPVGPSADPRVGSAIDQPPSLAGILACARSLGVQPQMPIVAGKRDFVIPVHDDNREGLYYFTDSGVSWIDLSEMPNRGTFSTNINLDGRKLKLLGEKFDKSWHEFKPSDITSNAVIKNIPTAPAHKVANPKLALELFELFLTERVERDEKSLMTMANTPPKPKIDALLGYNNRLALCTSGVGRPLELRSRQTIARLGAIGLRLTDPNAPTFTPPSAYPHRWPARPQTQGARPPAVPPRATH